MKTTTNGRCPQNIFCEISQQSIITDTPQNSDDGKHAMEEDLNIYIRSGVSQQSLISSY
jgi:hypothetical protein